MTTPATPDAPAATLDVKDIKSMLNLPETATDMELITSLVTLIAALQEKYDALLADATASEQKMANRDLEDFADVIAPEARQFWGEQLITNRESALIVLSGLRAKLPEPAAAPAAPVKPAPLPVEGPALSRVEGPRIRLTNRIRTVAELAGDPPPADQATAAKIRNRACAIAQTEKIPFMAAFRRATQELGEAAS